MDVLCSDACTHADIAPVNAVELVGLSPPLLGLRLNPFVRLHKTKTNFKLPRRQHIWCLGSKVIASVWACVYCFVCFRFDITQNSLSTSFHISHTNIQGGPKKWHNKIGTLFCTP